MNESTPIPAATQPLPDPPARNAAVQRCSLAYDKVYSSSRRKGLNDFDSRQDATIAYRGAMPDLSGYENIRDFIACTAQGMLLEAIDSIEGAKFLYAAQSRSAPSATSQKTKNNAPDHPPPPYPVVTIRYLIVISSVSIEICARCIVIIS